MNENILIQKIKKYLNTDEKIQAYLFATSSTSVGLTFLIGFLSALNSRFYILVLTDKRLIVVKLSFNLVKKPSEFNPVNAVGIPLNDIQYAEMKKSMAATMLSFQLTNKSQVRFLTSGQARGFEKQSENFELFKIFAGKYPVISSIESKMFGFNYTSKEIITIIICQLATIFLLIFTRLVFVSLSPILFFLFPLFSYLLICLKIKKNLHSTGMLSGLIYGLFYDVFILLTSHLNITSFIIFPIFFSLMGLVVAFIIGIIVGKDKYKDYL